MKKITLLIYCRLSVLSLTFLLSAVVSLTYSQSLTINEIMSSNASTIADEDSDFEDWIEIYNFGTTPVALVYFGLSDNFSEPYRWIFPDVTVQPGEFIIVWTSGKNHTNPNTPLHTNFSIKAEGEEVLLTSPFGTLTSLVQPIAIPADVSYGRSPDGTGYYFFFATPTPGSSNNTPPFSEIVEPPVFSHHGGFYTEGFNLSLSHPDPGVTIIFTLYGSYPDIENLEGTSYTYKNQYPENPGDPFGELIPGSYLSYIYTDSIFITDRSTVPDSITQISSTWHKVPFYIPENPVFKGTVIRARALKSGALSSPVCTNTYFITSQGQARYSLPAISLSIPEYGLFDYEDGIYVAGVDYDNWRIANHTAGNSWSTVCNFDRRGDEWVIRSHLEFYDPEAALPKISQELGIRIHGSEARRRPMKSLRLYARGQYGKSELQHKFFNKLDDQSFKRILLRNSGQDFLSTMIRDATMHSITNGLHFDTREYEPAAVFINGEYRGIHNIRERYDKYYFERVYGVDPDNLDYISSTEINEGDTVHYNQTICYIQQNGLIDEEHYQYIQTRIDVKNFTDYQIANLYSDNVDWPGNNLEFWRLRTPGYTPNAHFGHDGRWRWLLYDIDFCFGMWSGSLAALHNTLEMATLAGGTAHPNPDWATFLLRKFLENDQFRKDFNNRFADLMNTYFYPSRVISVIDQLSARIAPEIPEHIMRWKIPDNISACWYFLQEMRDFATIRPAYQRQHIIDHFGLDGLAELTLDVIDQSNGHIRINTVESNENTPGVDSVPYPWTGTYFKGIPIEIEAIPAPGYAFSHWQGLPCGTPQVAIVTPEENISIRAHFVETTEPQLLFFWIFDTSLPNDLPLQQINAKFQLSGDGLIHYHSALLDYPFYAGHPNWRKASMERRNTPTEINYRPEGNNGVSYSALIKTPSATAGTMNISDIAGRLIVTQSLKANTVTKLHTSLKTGIYILQIIASEQILVKKIITGY